MSGFAREIVAFLAARQ